jgi:hypothetical protein
MCYGTAFTLTADVIVAALFIGVAIRGNSKSKHLKHNYVEFDKTSIVILIFAVLYYTWRLLMHNPWDPFYSETKEDRISNDYLATLCSGLFVLMYAMKLFISVITLFLVILFDNAEE